jgi:hypothetical protein
MESVPSARNHVLYHHLGNNNVPAMFRNELVCAVANVDEIELEAVASLE